MNLTPEEFKAKLDERNKKVVANGGGSIPMPSGGRDLSLQQDAGTPLPSIPVAPPQAVARSKPPPAPREGPKVEASLFDMAFSLAKEMIKSGKALIKGDQVMSTEEETARRLAICMDGPCEFFVENSMRCAKCGCKLKYKKLLATAGCPLGKW